MILLKQVGDYGSDEGRTRFAVDVDTLRKR